MALVVLVVDVFGDALLEPLEHLLEVRLLVAGGRLLLRHHARGLRTLARSEASPRDRRTRRSMRRCDRVATACETGWRGDCRRPVAHVAALGCVRMGARAGRATVVGDSWHDVGGGRRRDGRNRAGPLRWRHRRDGFHGGLRARDRPARARARAGRRRGPFAPRRTGTAHHRARGRRR